MLPAVHSCQPAVCSGESCSHAASCSQLPGCSHAARLFAPVRGCPGSPNWQHRAQENHEHRIRQYAELNAASCPAAPVSQAPAIRNVGEGAQHALQQRPRPLPWQRTLHVTPTHTHTNPWCQVVGDVEELGSWDAGKGAQLTWSHGNIWTATVMLPPGQTCEFKVRAQGQASQNLCTWQIAHRAGSGTVMLPPGQACEFKVRTHEGM
jgi:hypothetical protein